MALGVAVISSALAMTGCSEADLATETTPESEAFPEGGGEQAPLLEPSIGYPPSHPNSLAPEEDGPREDLKIGVDPAVFGLTPNEGLAIGGDVVTIQGENFVNGAQVYFADTLVHADDVFYINDQFINVTTPAGTPGWTAVKITNPDGAEGVLEDAFLFVDDLEVHSISPALGHPMGGTPITIEGRGFEPGVVVMVGERIATEVVVESGALLEAISPPGTLGLATVRVILPGQEVAWLEDAFRYAGAPHLQSAWPPHGPTVGGTSIEISGMWFEADSEVTIGGKSAEVVDVSADGRTLEVIAPGGAAGLVDVTVTHAFGEGTLANAFTYMAPTDAFQVWSMTPQSGPVAGGYTATLVVTGLDPDLSVSVKFGENVAPVVEQGLYPDTLFVEVPSGEPGFAAVTLGQTADWLVVPGGFVYTEQLTASGLAPQSADQAGGTKLTLYGAAFESAASLAVSIGGQDVGAVQVASDSQAVFSSPVCSPGQYDVVVSDGETEIFMQGAFECTASQPQLLAVDPPQAAQAGGALIKVLGIGLPAQNTAVSFGGLQGSEVQWESPLGVWARVPRGEEGPVDVVLTGGTHELSLVDGLMYFNPANKKMGVWGKGIHRTVNVSIFDSSTGDGVQAATAILGADENTKFQCTTADRGQCTISYHDLRGEQTVTAAKKSYSAYTIAGFHGTNVTLFIRPQDPPVQQGPPSGPGGSVNVQELTGTIEGKVHGIGKYVLPPPPNCNIIGSPDGEQCTACDEQTLCPGQLVCEPLAAIGSFCLKPCDTNDDCSDGFLCAVNGTGPVCVPHGGDVSAYCETSRRSFFGSNPEPGFGSFVDEEGNFSITSRMGEVTVYCIAGYTSPNGGVFVPTMMGIHPTVVVGLDKIVPEVDVEMTIPLRRTLRMRLFDPPEHAAGVQMPYYRQAVDIGAEGWIPFTSTPTWVDGEMRYFAGYPESLAPFGKDAAYTFYTSMAANASPTPQSYRLAYRLKTLDGEPVRIRSAETSEWLEPTSGMQGDLHGIWGTGPDNLWGVGPGGRMVHKGPLGWSPQPNFTNIDLNAIWGSAADAIVAVGDKGTILQFAGATWKPAFTTGPVKWTLRDVHGQWIVGDGGILRRVGTQWLPQSVLHSSGLRGVYSLADDLAFAVGDAGKMLTWNGTQWSSEIVGPADGRSLNAVSSDGQVVVAVGDQGTIVWRPLGSGEWQLAEPVTPRDLTSVTHNAGGTFYLGGTVGTLVSFVPAAELVVDESRDGQLQLEMRDLWAHEGLVYAAGTTAVAVGPWMAFPEPKNPTFNAFMDKDYLNWEFLDGGAEATFNALFMSSADGFTVWSVVAAGHLSQIELPRLVDVIGYDPVPIGQKYFNLTRALNPDFTMEEYRFSHLSMWRRTTWSTAYGTYY